MKKISISTFLAMLVIMAGSGTSTAQDAGMLIIPVEMFVCTYNEGKGPRDLDRVVAKWTKWADDNGVDDYAAWTLTPYYYGPGANANIDVIWMGAGKSAAALGTVQDKWLASNGGIDDEFEAVMSCGSHVNFASINVKATPQGETPTNSVLTFSDCTYNEGATFAAVSGAMREWGASLSAEGSAAGIFNWYPAYGGGGEDFTFKLIQAHENLATLGADYDRYATGGGFVTRGKLLNHLVSCDSSRAYLAQNRRFVQLR